MVIREHCWLSNMVYVLGCLKSNPLWVAKGNWPDSHLCQFTNGTDHTVQPRFGRLWLRHQDGEPVLGLAVLAIRAACCELVAWCLPSSEGQ